MTLEIDEIHPGGYLGNLENKNGISFTAVSSTCCDCIVVSRYDIEGVESKKLRDFLQRENKPYPSDRNVRQVYFDSLKWTSFKKGYLENFYREVQNKKR